MLRVVIEGKEGRNWPVVGFNIRCRTTHSRYFP